MKRSLSLPLLILILVMAAFPSSSRTQTPPVPSPPALSLEPAALHDFLTRETASRGLVGLSLAVAREGRLVFAEGAGRSSIAPEAGVTAETPFAIGSVTKQFTSACVLLLAEEGKLAVTDRVAKWFPELTASNEITLLDLMNHVSGYPDYYPLDFVERPMAAPISPQDLIHRFAARPLDFEPGTRYSYSNTGYIILGEVVTRVSGMPFGEFLERRILRPLGLTRTVYEPDRNAAGVTRGYSQYALSGPELSVPEGRGWVGSAGGLFSTASDIVKWDLALIEGRVLNPESLKLMTTPRTLKDGTVSNYGCGLSIGHRDGRLVYSHGGGVAGFIAQNSILPESRSAVVLLSNFDSPQFSGVFRPVMGAVLSATPAPETTPETASASKKPDVPRGVPSINGLPATDEARLILGQLQKGRIDRTLLGEEFSWFLTEEKIRGASARLSPYGEPETVGLESLGERGGMEVSEVLFTYASGALGILMYRTPDGRVQEFFIFKAKKPARS
jgi:D-alanyl-D-alanine carboxypeptidase